MENDELMKEIRNKLNFEGNTFEELCLISLTTERDIEITNIGKEIVNYLHIEQPFAMAEYYKTVINEMKTPGELVFLMHVIGIWLGREILKDRMPQEWIEEFMPE